MIRNAVIAVIAFFMVFWVLAAVMGNGAVILYPAVLVGLIIACTTRILQEINALRREIRGEEEEPSEGTPPLSERLAAGNGKEEE
ncbi:MAG: hypothetical protein ACOYIE_01715 [Agathobaculum sp.]|jgi:uncharacterized membrane protein|uniref:hypothetical protein n=1 Tax=Agathobaculum sp. TaxID=2048138 RepID=UPI003D9460A3